MTARHDGQPAAPERLPPSSSLLGLVAPDTAAVCLTITCRTPRLVLCFSRRYLALYDMSVYIDAACVSAPTGDLAWCNSFNAGQECRSCWNSCQGARSFLDDFMWLSQERRDERGIFPENFCWSAVSAGRCSPYYYCILLVLVVPIMRTAGKTPSRLAIVCVVVLFCAEYVLENIVHCTHFQNPLGFHVSALGCARTLEHLFAFLACSVQVVRANSELGYAADGQRSKTQQ